MIVEDPRGRYPMGIIEAPALVSQEVPRGSGYWILDTDGTVYFGHQLPPPEPGFGITQQLDTAPEILLKDAATMILSLLDAMEDHGGEDLETMERLPEVIMEGLGVSLDEAEDHAEAIFEEAERLDECPWKLTAMHVAGVPWGRAAEPEFVGQFPKEKREGPKGDAKIIPFPIERVRKPAKEE
jgi:hypothetical protein